MTWGIYSLGTRTPSYTVKSMYVEVVERCYVFYDLNGPELPVAIYPTEGYYVKVVS